MSGFIALFNTDGAPVDRGLLEKLTRALQFKGPDNQKTWANGQVGFGHTLFQTTHEAKYETQPSSVDGNAWITGCIRIDEREELINRLGIKDKIKPDQTPDSELVLHAYRKWGERCTEQLLGDFAFVIRDAGKRQLFCARDHFGMRQLYYARANGSIIISNSLHCLHQHPSISKRLNEQAMGDFLLMGDHMWMDQAQTAFADIQALLPAHVLIARADGLSIKRYWDLPRDTPVLRYRKPQEYLEHFDEIFKLAVADRLRAPSVVISLSGGLDSTSIAATVREIQAEGQQVPDLHAVTVDYESIHSSDEKYFTELVTQHLKLPTQLIDASQYAFMSPPVQTTRPLELYQPKLWLDVDQQASRLGRVLLTGEAGDNLLIAGSIMETLKDVGPISRLAAQLPSAIYHLKALYGVYPALGSGLKAKINRVMGKKPAHSTLPYPAWLNPEFEAKLKLEQRWSSWHRWQPPSVYAGNAHLYESLLKPDWNTDDYYMHTAFTQPEKRDPFLDLRLVKLVTSLPALPWLFKKHILRSCMRDRLPGEIVTRAKNPLGTIHTSLIKQPEAHWTDDWQSTPELDCFIDRRKVPPFDEDLHGVAESYISLRPYLLKNWLLGL